MRDVLYIVNIHGTSGGRALLYPTGISQLLGTFAGEDDILAGSDVYFDDMTIANFHDMTLANGMTDAVLPFGKPLCCMEFNAGDSNFGDDFMTRNRASATDFKTRLFLAQGNRLLNYYLFCGGQNYRFPDRRGDGNDRCAITGENHGYAAPIGPEGEESKDYPRMKRVCRQMAAQADRLAGMRVRYDDVAFGFLPDDWMDESHTDLSEDAREMFRARQAYRGGSCWDATVHALLLLGVKPRTVWLRPGDPGEIVRERCLIVPGTGYMDPAIQKTLVRYVREGGHLLLHGRIPRFDPEGAPCTILADALGIRQTGSHSGWDGTNPAVCHTGALAGFREFFTDEYETYDISRADADVLLRLYETGEPCGVSLRSGDGGAVILGCRYRTYFPQYRILLGLLGVTQTLTHDIREPGYGVWMTDTVDDGGQEYLHLVNLDDVDKEFHVFCGGKPWLGRSIFLPADDALLLMRNHDFGFVRVFSASCELLETGERSLVFRITEKNSDFVLACAGFTCSVPTEQEEIRPGVLRVRTDNRLADDRIEFTFPAV